MRFDCYGRFVLEIERREGGGWQVLEVSTAEGKRRLRDDIAVPSHLQDSEIRPWLEVLLHELGGSGRTIRLLDDDRGP